MVKKKSKEIPNSNFANNGGEYTEECSREYAPPAGGLHRLRNYTPLNEMKTTCLGRCNYDEPGFNQYTFLDNLKRGIMDLHKPLPKALIFTQTSAANRSFLIKEAFKNAFPNEKIPVFLTIDPKPIRYWLSYKSEKQAGTPPAELMDKLVKKMKNKLNAYGISEGEIIVVDEFLGRALGELSREDGRGHYENPAPGTSLQIATEIVQRAVDSDGLKIGVSSYNFVPLSQWDPNEANGPWIKYDETTHGRKLYGRADTREERKISRSNIAYLKTIGETLGKEIREEKERRQNLEQRASSTTAVIAFIGSLFFTTSTFTGNAIGTLSNSTTNLIGIILFLLGMVGIFFYIRKNK
ncbi:MAG: hypothetical protein WCI72_05950 [archaeon]